MSTGPDVGLPASDREAPGGLRGRLVAAAFALTVLAFWPSVASFPTTWSSQYGSPGYAVTGVTVWLIWRERRFFLQGRHGWLPALLPLAAFSAIWLAAQAAGVQVVHQAAFAAGVFLWSLAVLGLASLRHTVPIAATFLLAIPVWDVLIPPLQAMTTFSSGNLVRLLGIDAVIREDTISISTGTFLVAGSCAGLAFLLAGLLVGACYSHLFMRGWRTRIGVVVLAGALSIVSNWIRVASLIVLGEVTAMQSPVIYEHGWVGWVVFGVMLVPFFLLARRMERWNTAADARGGHVPALLDRGVPIRALGATAVAASGPALFYLIGALPSVAPLPGEVSGGPGWTRAASVAAPSWEVQYPEPDRAETRLWVKDSAEVLAHRRLYLEQSQGREVVNDLNRIAPDSLLLRDRVVGPVDRAGRSVREAWIRNAGGVTLVWYWYRVAGATTVSPVRAKLMEVAGFFSRRREAELVLVATPCDGEDCEAAVRRLFDFIQPEAPLQVPAP